jgi:hypothetical protein
MGKLRIKPNYRAACKHCKQGFDLVASPSRTFASLFSSQSTDCLPDGFLLVHNKGPSLTES